MYMTVVPPPSIATLVAHASGRCPLHVAAGDRLVEDLRLDSMDVAGLFIDIENVHGVILPPEVVKSIRTVADLDAAVIAQGCRQP